MAEIYMPESLSILNRNGMVFMKKAVRKHREVTWKNPCSDRNGREIIPGDLIRVFHYKDARTKRLVYMHKLVVLCNEKREADPDGQWLYGVDVLGIGRKGMDLAHRFLLTSEEMCGDREIIDGLVWRSPENGLFCWYERPRKKKASKK